MRNFGGLPNSRDPIKPRFHIEAVQDEAASTASGRPMFRDQERVEIVIPGNPHSRPVCIVNDEHRMRWPAEYAAFKAGITMAVDGTPIEQWPLMSRAMVKTLKFLEIHTVEQCAKLDDQALQRIGLGAREIKNAAIAYLDEAEGMKLTTQLSHAIEQKDAELAALRAQVKELGEASERMERQLRSLHERPMPADTFIPTLPEPPAPQPPAFGTSALDGFQAPRRRGRPPQSVLDAMQREAAEAAST